MVSYHLQVVTVVEEPIALVAIQMLVPFVFLALLLGWPGLAALATLKLKVVVLHHVAPVAVFVVEAISTLFAFKVWAAVAGGATMLFPSMPAGWKPFPAGTALVHGDCALLLRSLSSVKTRGGSVWAKLGEFVGKIDFPQTNACVDGGKVWQIEVERRRDDLRIGARPGSQRSLEGEKEKSAKLQDGC